MLVLGTHGRAGLGKLLIGSVAEEVFRRASCPVMTVGPHASSKVQNEIHFQHILFATDFSPDSLAALPYAVSLAKEDQAKLTFLHVVEQPAAGIVDLDAVTSALMLRLHKLIPAAAAWRSSAARWSTVWSSPINPASIFWMPHCSTTDRALSVVFSRTCWAVF